MCSSDLQLLSTPSVMDHASRSFARIEVIHIFHKRDKLGFRFDAKLPSGLEIRMYVKAWKKISHGGY